MLTEINTLREQMKRSIIGQELVIERLPINLQIQPANIYQLLKIEAKGYSCQCQVLPV